MDSCFSLFSWLVLAIIWFLTGCQMCSNLTSRHVYGVGMFFNGRRRLLRLLLPYQQHFCYLFISNRWSKNNVTPWVNTVSSAHLKICMRLVGAAQGDDGFHRHTAAVRRNTFIRDVSVPFMWQIICVVPLLRTCLEKCFCLFGMHNLELESQSVQLLNASWNIYIGKMIENSGLFIFNQIEIFNKSEHSILFAHKRALTTL